MVLDDVEVEVFDEVVLEVRGIVVVNDVRILVGLDEVVRMLLGVLL